MSPHLGVQKPRVISVSRSNPGLVIPTLRPLGPTGSPYHLSSSDWAPQTIGSDPRAQEQASDRILSRDHGASRRGMRGATKQKKFGETGQERRQWYEAEPNSAPSTRKSDVRPSDTPSYNETRSRLPAHCPSRVGLGLHQRPSASQPMPAHPTETEVEWSELPTARRELEEAVARVKLLDEEVGNDNTTVSGWPVMPCSYTMHASSHKDRLIEMFPSELLCIVCVLYTITCTED